MKAVITVDLDDGTYATHDIDRVLENAASALLNELGKLVGTRGTLEIGMTVEGAETWFTSVQPL